MLVVNSSFGGALSDSIIRFLGNKAKMTECNSFISKGFKMTCQNVMIQGESQSGK